MTTPTDPQSGKTCGRLGCGHAPVDHAAQVHTVLAKMAKGGCKWTEMTSWPCKLCTCSNVTAKQVDRRGIPFGHPRYDAEAVCKPRTEITR